MSPIDQIISGDSITLKTKPACYPQNEVKEKFNFRSAIFFSLFWFYVSFVLLMPLQGLFSQLRGSFQGPIDYFFLGLFYPLTILVGFYYGTGLFMLIGFLGSIFLAVKLVFLVLKLRILYVYLFSVFYTLLMVFVPVFLGYGFFGSQIQLIESTLPLLYPTIIPALTLILFKKGHSNEIVNVSLLRSLKYGVLIIIFLFLTILFSFAITKLAKATGERTRISQLEKTIGYYSPDYLPIGVIKDREYELARELVRTYLCPNNGTLFINQAPLESDRYLEYKHFLEGKAINYEELIIKSEIRGFYQLSPNKRVATLYWANDKVVFMVRSSDCGFSKEELKRIAESLK